jgi:3-hydroxyisobutyrate dehydrogenase
MKEKLFGFIGMGNMGQPMAQHIVHKGYRLLVHDTAGTKERAPENALIAQSNAEVVARAEVVALSLPTVEVNQSVVREIAEMKVGECVIVDTCTIGPAAANENSEVLAKARLGYVDSPISGLRFRAVEGNLTSMVSGPTTQIEQARPLIECYSKNIFVVGEQAGQGQQMKMINNALCISSYVTTSEALAYGEAGGLQLETMLGVINASSGQSFATTHTFPKFVTSGKFNSGCEAHIIEKDLRLFVDDSLRQGTNHAVIAKALERVTEFVAENRNQDQFRIYPFIKSSEK